MQRRDGYHWSEHSWQPSSAQRRVLDQLMRGESNAAIARSLGRSPETVKTHIATLLAETGCADRAELARWWRAQRGTRLSVLALALAPRLAAAAAAALIVGTVGTLGVAALTIAHRATPRPSTAVVTPSPAIQTGPDLCADGPTLGEAPNEQYLGCMVIEPDTGFSLAHVPGAGDASKSALYRERALVALTSGAPYPPTPSIWPATPTNGHTAPYASGAQGFQGRIVIEFWSQTTRVAVTAGSLSRDALLQAARTMLQNFAIRDATPATQPAMRYVNQPR